MIRIFVIFIVLICGIAHADNYITQNVIGGCDATDLLTVNNKTKLTPIFEPIEYTCKAGTFLPANTTQCAPCPNGFTCPGGTFAFDESKAGGIIAPVSITQNSANICSTNVLKSVNNKTQLKPIFEPKTVSLNWNDDNGHSGTTTCTYDSTVNLPPTPSRAGYTFTGWKLETNN